MAKAPDGFEQMMDFWQQGQEAFLSAQKSVADSFQQSITGVGAAPKPAADAMNVWNDFIKTWAPGWDVNALAAKGGEAMMKQGQDALMSALDPAMWTQNAPEELRKILQSVAQGPQFADLATPQIDAANSWREVLDYQSAAGDLAKVMQEAWAKTYARYSEDFSLEDLQAGNMKEALDAWLKSANAELMEIQRSPAFMDAQKRMLRASMEIKARQRDLAETWSENYQMPTRSEIDDLTKIVHELRREVRKLKRELAATKN